MLISSNLDKEKTLQIANKNNTNPLEIIDLDNQRIPYTKMPDLLSQYEYFMEEKVTNFGEHLQEFSSTGLQALACGCKVIHQGKEYNVLPKYRQPNQAVTILEIVYSSLSLDFIPERFNFI